MIKITRSFSRKIMLAQYEPIESFCSAEEVVDMEQMVQSKEKYLETVERVSAELDEICRTEVEKTISEYLDKKNMCSSCKGIIRYKDEGKLCEPCKKTAHYQTKNN